MEVICLEDKAFYALIEKVVERVKEVQSIKEERWVSAQVAMNKLGISSKTTLQALRNTGAIRFSQPQKKIIMYDVSSINDYLAKHAKETF